MKNKCLKIYFNDMKETLLTYIVMMIIISGIVLLLQLPFYFHFINLIIIIFFVVYFFKEITIYFKIKGELIKNNVSKKIVVFDKVETDFKYGKAKRREFFKKYFTPRYSFYYDKELFRIGFNLDPIFYNEIRGKEFEIEYLEETRFIISIKPLFTVVNKDLYIKCLGNCIFSEDTK